MKIQMYKNRYGFDVVVVGEVHLKFWRGGYIPTTYNPNIRQQIANNQSRTPVCTMTEFLLCATDIEVKKERGIIFTPYENMTFVFRSHTLLPNEHSCYPLGQKLVFRRTNAIYETVWQSFDAENNSCEEDNETLFTTA
jgi:hypothetical protein